MSLQIKKLYKSFSDRTILKGIDLSINEGEIVFILGRSGTGKSVLLKNIVGLMKPDGGEIWLDGEEISQKSEEEYFQVRKKCGMVFQHPALFDSMNVFDNVAFGLRRHFPDLSDKELNSRVQKSLELIKLGHIESQLPGEISYGMQKRVSLARTIAIDPRYLLFDEPTTGLDPVTTGAINKLILSLSRKLKTTSIVVSHDMKCALDIADRIVVLDQGKIVDQGTPSEITQSKVPLVKDFFKPMIIFREMGLALLFLKQIFKTLVHTPLDRKALYSQIYLVSSQALLTTAFSGFFVGAIMTVQFSTQLKEFGALSVLGGLATSATIRELGPLLIAFMLSGKIGAYTSAELGTMRVTEQIDAIRCLGTNPIEYLIIPRFLAINISGFILFFTGLLASILGGAILGVLVGGMNFQEYLNGIPRFVTLSSILIGLFKCFSFSFLLAIICTYKGYFTTGGAKGVGRTVVVTALSTMVGIVLVDWLTSFLARSLGALWPL